MDFGGNTSNVNANAAPSFHGYRRLPSEMRAPEMAMALPPHPPPLPQSATGEEIECVVREQDRFMPIANVIRIMRKILPPHAKISDDAKETIQECVSEYISFITSEANDRCQREQRKTITAEDVLWAMSKLGFDDYIEPLTLYLHRYREFDGSDRGSHRGGDNLMKRVLQDQGVGFPGFHQGTTTFHHMGAPHPGFFGATPSQQQQQQPPPMNLFKDVAGPSSAMEGFGKDPQM